MMSAEQSLLLKNASILKDQIGNFIKQVMNAEDNWPDVYGSKDPEEQYNRNMLYLAAYKLQDGADIINSLFSPVLAEGKLVKSPHTGRYTLPGLGYDLSSGCGIELLIDGVWHRSRIEHNGDYYIYGYPDLKLEGLYVRVK